MQFTVLILGYDMIAILKTHTRAHNMRHYTGHNSPAAAKFKFESLIEADPNTFGFVGYNPERGYFVEILPKTENRDAVHIHRPRLRLV